MLAWYASFSYVRVWALHLCVCTVQEGCLRLLTFLLLHAEEDVSAAVAM